MIGAGREERLGGAAMYVQRAVHLGELEPATTKTENRALQEGKWSKKRTLSNPSQQHASLVRRYCPLCATCCTSYVCLAELEPETESTSLGGETHFEARWRLKNDG